MNAITYFKLNSPYEGDITKNCALTGSEVDNNFFTLESRDIKSVKVEDDKITITLMNGDELTTDTLTEDCIKEITFDFDEVNGVLTITKDGITQTISGFATNYNTGDTTSVDGTLTGNGLPTSPIGISPTSKTGQYRPVKQIINTLNGEKLPTLPYVYAGDRYLTIEKVNEYGFLYNYEGLKKIAQRLGECGSEWRIPTKEDWDDMLNAVEPNEDARNHSDARANKYLGEFAGKFLKSKDYWKKTNTSTIDSDEDTCITYDDCNDYHECACNEHTACHPNYCGEYGHCHHRHNDGGIDKYGFNALPAGYANEAKDYLYFKERAYFWTATNHEYRDAYIKAFMYNKSCVLQDIMASDNYMSVRLVKDFNGENFREREDILGGTYSTVLMPSMKNGRNVWTAVNLSVGDCGCSCKHVLPNGGEGMEFKTKYFTNEWTGKGWLKKELADGESVVVIGEHDEYAEYRVVNGELVDVSNMIYEKVMTNIQPQLDDLRTEISEVDQRLNTKIDDEISRSTEKDNELDDKITTGLNDLNTKIDDEISRSTEKDNELDDKITNINDNINNINDQIVNINTDITDIKNDIDENLLTEGEFDQNTGKLSLKNKDGEEKIEIQFGFNFGTF